MKMHRNSIVDRHKSTDEKSNNLDKRDRNEPSRFFGDGAVFKAKLIGILEVGEARGDRMCQEALQDLKMAIRAAGEHKQKITIHVTIDGLRLRDEKTGDSLYHHPVHKISFIAQDMTDSRAFGYIFGSPDSGHRFFGIKTDKTASQVVLAMRDLFQVVFELKKKEIELARQHIQNKITQHEHQAAITALTNKSADSYKSTNGNDSSYKGLAVGGIGGSESSAKLEKSPESVADLVDLELELSHIQRGITQMERITPSDPTPRSIAEKEDPFGDSFSATPVYNLLPPPEPPSKRNQKSNRSESEPLTELAEVLSKAQAPLATSDDWFNTPPQSATEMRESVSFGDDVVVSNLAGPIEKSTSTTDVFTELDPLGTGKIRPYVDKKYFFQDLKNPPKKVLRDLSGTCGMGQESLQFDTNFGRDEQRLSLSDIQSLENLSSGIQIRTTASGTLSAGTEFDPFKEGTTDPFTDDPFNTDPFESPLSKSASPFEHKISDDGRKSEPPVFNGPLQVSLPPESNWNTGTTTHNLERSDSISPTPHGIVRNRPVGNRFNAVDIGSTLGGSKKSKQNLLPGSKFGKRDVNIQRLQETDSLSESEAPEPPPRPDSVSHVEPPPLPPKKQFSDLIIRPNSSSSITSRESTRYDFLSNNNSNTHSSSKQIQKQDENAPPLPLPSRRLGKIDSSYPGPGRPQKQAEDDYLTPLGTSEIPTLLPPPQKKDQTKVNRGGSRTRSENEKPLFVEDRYTSTFISQNTSALESGQNLEEEMTVSKLLSMRIDELATKLGVPVSKLSTMTLLELTSYLNDFVDNSKMKQSLHRTVSALASNDTKQRATTLTAGSAVFKVNFDSNFGEEGTFFAKFDDNFGEDKFEANFDKANNLKPEPQPASADRYADLRKIIEEELQSQPPATFETLSDDKVISSLSPSHSPTTVQLNDESPPAVTKNRLDLDREVKAEISRLSPNLKVGNVESVIPVQKIDTKITEVISQARDPYAALRDIILVEDLFEKPPMITKTSEDAEKNQLDSFESFEEKVVADENSGAEAEKSTGCDMNPNDEESQSSITNNADITNDHDEVEELKKGISNASLNSQEEQPTHFNQSSSYTPLQEAMLTEINKSPSNLLATSHKASSGKTTDMSTSPIPIQKSPTPSIQANASNSFVEQLEKNNKSPQPLTTCQAESLSESSQEVEKKKDTQVNQTGGQNWSAFDSNRPEPKPIEKRQKAKGNRESPCSSDGKNEWKEEHSEYGRRLRTQQQHQTSSSSRDLSPWEEEGPEYRHRIDRFGHPSTSLGSHRRLDSCDDDYDYDIKYDRSRRPPKEQTVTPFVIGLLPDQLYQIPYFNSNSGLSMRRTIIEDSHHPWSPERGPYDRPHYSCDSWSPEDENSRRRAFERGSYERNTYGPPFDSRESKSLNTYERRYDKRKYYRERVDYPCDDEPYEDVYEPNARGKRNNYENVYEFARGNRARDFYYTKEKRSFESNDSYDSRGRRSFGSGEIYSSYDRDRDYRDRYVDKGRLMKGRNARSKPDLEQDSDNDMIDRMVSLQRGRPKPQIQLDDDVWGSSTGKSTWKRPQSATEPDRRISDNKRVLQNPTIGSDGEKDRRLRRRSRGRGKEDDYVASYATIRYPARRRENFYDMEPDEAADEEYYNRRQQQYYKTSNPRLEKGEKSRYAFQEEFEDPRRFKINANRDLSDKGDRYRGGQQPLFDDMTPKTVKHVRMEFDYEYENTPQTASSGRGNGKFNFDDAGFDSDFTSPASNSESQPHSKPFRFSTDFLSKDSPKPSKGFANFDSAEFSGNLPTLSDSVSNLTNNPPSTSGSTNTITGSGTKLRFNENVQVSQFEDDFSRAEIEEADDQWNEMPLKSNKLTTRQQHQQQTENLKKSESINIFARKKDVDPFEDDPFFGSSSKSNNNDANPTVASGKDWDKGFATFEDNM